jgi:hypothetical protein
MMMTVSPHRRPTRPLGLAGRRRPSYGASLHRLYVKARSCREEYRLGPGRRVLEGEFELVVRRRHGRVVLLGPRRSAVSDPAGWQPRPARIRGHDARDSVDGARMRPPPFRVARRLRPCRPQARPVGAGELAGRLGRRGAEGRCPRATRAAQPRSGRYSDGWLRIGRSVAVAVRDGLLWFLAAPKCHGFY